MPSWQDEPQVGQSVWCDSHKNGIITRIDWSGRTVYSDHYDNGQTTHDFDEFFGCFDEALNQWVIVPI